MTVFATNFPCMYIGGTGVIVAETKRKAFNALKKEVEKIDAKSAKLLTMDDLWEVDTEKDAVHILSNGDV